MQNACKTSTLFHKVQFLLRHLGEHGRRLFLARRRRLEEQRSRAGGTGQTDPGAEAEGAAIGARAGGSKDLEWPRCYSGGKTWVWLSLALPQSHGIGIDGGILHPLRQPSPTVTSVAGRETATRHACQSTRARCSTTRRKVLK